MKFLKGLKYLKDVKFYQNTLILTQEIKRMIGISMKRMTQKAKMVLVKVLEISTIMQVLAIKKLIHLKIKNNRIALIKLVSCWLMN